MAQKIIGLDIGSFSVKVSTLSTSFRSYAWEGYREFEIPHAGRGRPERAAAQVLADLGKQVQGAVVVTAVPGDRVMTRFMELPFADPKRIDSVLGFELEGQIPLSVEEMTYAYQTVGTTESGQTELFAAAVKHDVMERYLAGLQDNGLDPRVITLDTISYVNLYDHLVGEGICVFVDIGHQTTKICIVEDGRMRVARSIGRGGRSVTQALADSFEIPFDEAEQLKHAQGEVPRSDSEMPPTPLAQACGAAMQPVVMAIRQTCQAFARQHGRPVDQILVTGGGSRLTNTMSWLQHELSAPVRALSLEALEFNKVSNVEGSATGAAKSLGLALHHAATSKNVSTLNFRRGDYAYEGDYKYLQDKLAYLSGLAAALVVVGAIYGVVRNNNLQKTLDAQYAALGEFTEDKLGKREKSFSKTVKKLKRPPTRDGDVKLFPDMTAIAVLERVTLIQERLNAGGPAPGPTPPAPPGIQSARDRRSVRPGPIGKRPGVIDAGIRRRLNQPGIPRPGMGAPTGIPGTGIQPGAARPGSQPSARPGVPAGKPGAKAGAKSGARPSPGGIPGGGDADKAAAPEADKRDDLKLELSQVDIDVFGDVEVTVETHESNVKGKEDFRKAIQAEPCFTEVKRRDIGEVVSTGRHQDWVRFEVTFKVDCPSAEGPVEEEDTKR
ncbi:MAG: type IV pilus assembly protein PilM [Myxococcota bacterium]|jgi:type IV pilus assembly protein PilM